MRADQPSLATQLSRPVVALAASGTAGSVTVHVRPDDLGPVTVRAQFDAGSVRVELFAGGDAGRDALRSALPDLRRELAAQTPGATIDVFAGAPQDQSAGQRAAQHGGRDGGSRGGRDAGRDPRIRGVRVAATPVPLGAGRSSPTHGIDILV